MGNTSSMDVIVIILLVIAAVFFAMAAFGVAARINLVAAGLLCWVLSVLLPALASL